MSKTYRRDAVDLDINDQPFPYNESWWDQYAGIVFSYPHRYDYYSKRNKKHDHKPWFKSAGWFKKMQGRARRAKVRDAMAHSDYDNIPCFRKTNDWEWT